MNPKTEESISKFIDDRADIRSIEIEMERRLKGEWRHVQRKRLNDGSYSYRFEIGRRRVTQNNFILNEMKDVRAQYPQIQSVRIHDSWNKQSNAYYSSLRIWIDVSDKKKV